MIKVALSNRRGRPRRVYRAPAATSGDGADGGTVDPLAGKGSGDRERSADWRRRALCACDGGELRFQCLDSAASSIDGKSSARLATMAEMVCASSGVSRPAPTSSSRSA